MIKKLLLIFFLLLSACVTKPQYYFYVYYAKTCPICQSFRKVVVPELENQYGKTMKIIEMDIDKEESIDAYAKTCSLLEDYYVNEHSGDVPFLVLDGYFVKVGYDIGDDQIFMEAIEKAIAKEELPSSLKDVYYFKEGKTFH